MTQHPLAPKVLDGRATDAELEEFFGPDLMNQLAHQWRGDWASKHAFIRWHRAVMEPIGITTKAAWSMFSGQTTIEAFVAGLDETTLERFLEIYPEKQAAYQAQLEDDWANDARRRGASS